MKIFELYNLGVLIKRRILINLRKSWWIEKLKLGQYWTISK